MGSINDASWEIDMSCGREESPVVLLNRFMCVCWRAKDRVIVLDSLGNHVSHVLCFILLTNKTNSK